jgi:hypothetical protein
MISTTHAIFRGLQDKLKSILKELPSDISPKIKSGLLKAHRKLSDYFTKFDESPYYTWSASALSSCFFNSINWIFNCLVLDPRITYEGLQDDYADDADLREGLEKSKIALYKHFNDQYSLPANSLSATPSTTLSISQTQPPIFDFTARFRRQVQRPSFNELDEYMRLPMVDFHSSDPIRWWYLQRHRFPRLYLLARDILAIPGL